MQSVVAIVLMLAWGLWFGGLMTLMLAVGAIFTTLASDRALAGRAASGVFHWFERYQLILAAVALLASFAWRVAQPRIASSVLFALLGLAAVGAVVNSAALTPKIETLRRAGETHTPQFERLHHTSTGVYTAQAVFMMLAGIALQRATSEKPAALSHAL